ncbi:hypothetical protein ACGFJC_52110 [Nonomuraea fuscirosea]
MTYLRLDQAFAGNTAGNVVILGMAAAGGGATRTADTSRTRQRQRGRL